MGTSQVRGVASQDIEAKIEKIVKIFCDNSLRVLRLKKWRQNNIKAILEIYESLSKLVGPMAEMVKIADTFESVRILIFEVSDDSAYDARVMARIQRNLDDYFTKSRYPTDQDLKIFHEFVKDKSYSMQVEDELINEFSATKGSAYVNPKALYYHSY